MLNKINVAIIKFSGENLRKINFGRRQFFTRVRGILAYIK